MVKRTSLPHNGGITAANGDGTARHALPLPLTCTLGFASLFPLATTPHPYSGVEVALLLAEMVQHDLRCLFHSHTPSSQPSPPSRSPPPPSPIVEVALLLAEMVQHDLRCLAFCKTRKLSELVLTYTKEVLRERAPHLVGTVLAYRAGYTAQSRVQRWAGILQLFAPSASAHTDQSPCSLPPPSLHQDRRRIERELFHGRLRAVAATSALELGVDVGALDATLHLGFHGSTASLWQQAGRAGRREKASLSIYVAFDGPLDQYFMAAPDRLFSRPIERCQLDAENPLVMRQQLQCAAAEMPLLEDVDGRFFGPSLAERIAELAGKGALGRSPENPEVDRGWRYIGAGKRPAQFVPVRAIDPNTYAVVEARTGMVLEEIEESKAFFVLYEGAVYLQQGRTFLVTSLDLEKREARCVRADVRYYTKTIDMVAVTIKGGTLAFPYPHMPSAKPASASLVMTSAHKVLKEAMTSAAHAAAPFEPVTSAHVAKGGVMTSAQTAPCEVTTRWIGYRKMWRGSGEPFETVEMTLPDVTYATQAVWVAVAGGTKAAVEAAGSDYRASLHAAAHALANMVPLFLACMASDMGVECASPYDSRFFPQRLLLYDKHPGGIGLAVQLQPQFPSILRAALELVTKCQCRLRGSSAKAQTCSYASPPVAADRQDQPDSQLPDQPWSDPRLTDRESSERESQDRESQGRESQDRESQDTESHDRESQDRESQDRESHDTESHDRESHDRESQDRDLIDGGLSFGREFANRRSPDRESSSGKVSSFQPSLDDTLVVTGRAEASITGHCYTEGYPTDDHRTGSYRMDDSHTEDRTEDCRTDDSRMVDYRTDDSRTGVPSDRSTHRFPDRIYAFLQHADGILQRAQLLLQSLVRHSRWWWVQRRRVAAFVIQKKHARGSHGAGARSEHRVGDEEAEEEGAAGVSASAHVRPGARAGGHGREEWYRRGLHILPGSPPRPKWNASDDSFLNSLVSRWHVQPYSSLPGVYLLQQPTDFACVLLIQDACYLFMQGKSKHHQPHTGIWFARDRTRDLSQISIINNVCHLYSDRLADALYESWLELSWHELAMALQREAVHGNGVRRGRGEAGEGRRGGERGGMEGRGKDRQGVWKSKGKGKRAERAGGGAGGEEVEEGGEEVGAGGVGGGMSVEDVREVARLHAAAVRKRKADQETTGQSTTAGDGLGYSLDALDAPEAPEASDGPLVKPVRLRDPSDDWREPGTGVKAQGGRAGERRAGRGVTGGGGGGERVEAGEKGGKASGKGETSVRGGGGGRETERKVKVEVVSARRKLLGFWGSSKRHSQGVRTQQPGSSNSSSRTKYHLPHMQPLQARQTTMDNLADGFTQEPDEQPPVDLSDLKRRSLHTYGRLSSSSTTTSSRRRLPKMQPLQARQTTMDNLADGFTQEPDEQPPVDLSDLKRRSLHTYGRLTNHLGMTRYVGVSEGRSRERLVRGMRGRVVRVGVVAMYGSAVGEFGRALVPLMEVAGHLEDSLGPQVDAEAEPGIFPGNKAVQWVQQQGGQKVEQEGRRQQGGEQQRRGDEGVVLFFPGDDSIRSPWTVHAARLLFGDATRVEAGRVAGQKFLLVKACRAYGAEGEGKSIHHFHSPRHATSPPGVLPKPAASHQQAAPHPSPFPPTPPPTPHSTPPILPHQVCFQNLLLPINKLHRPHSADLTRRRASQPSPASQASQATHATQASQASPASTATAQASQATQTPAATLHTPQPTHSHTEPLPGTPTIPTIRTLPSPSHQDAQTSSLAPDLVLTSQAISIESVSLQAMASAAGGHSGRRNPSILQEVAGVDMERGERVGGEGSYGNGSESLVRPMVYERRIPPKLAIHASPEERLAVGVAALPLGDKRRAAALANPLAAAAAAAAAAGGVSAGGVGVEEAGRRTDVGSKLREEVKQKQQDVGAKGTSSDKGNVNEQKKSKRERERKNAGVEGSEEEAQEDDPVVDAEAMARQEIDDYFDQYEEQHSTTHETDHDRRPFPTDTNFSTTSGLTPNVTDTDQYQPSAEPGATEAGSSPTPSMGGLQVPRQTFLYLLPDRDASGRLTGSTGKDFWQVTLVERDNVEGLKNQQEVVALIQAVFPELPVAVVRLGNMSLHDQVPIMKRTLVLVAVHDLILSTSLFFMPRGTVLLELFPYKLFSTQHKKLALRSGIHYMAWQNQYRYNAFFQENCFWRGGYKDTKDERRSQRRATMRAIMRATMRATMRAAMRDAAVLAFHGVAIAALLLSATCASATAHGHSLSPRSRSARALKALEVEPSPPPESHRESRRALKAVEVESIAGPGCVNAFPAKPLCKFVDSLASRVIPVLDGGSGKTLSIGVYQTYQKFHRDLPPTKIYAYGMSEKTASYPGPTIVAKKGVTTRVTWCNRLQDRQHMFTQDHTLMKGMPKPKKGGVPIDPNGDERNMKTWLPPWKRTVPLAIADRLFFKNGSINFPNVGVDPKVHPNWIPEYIGDTIVVNGVVWPYLRVRPAVYRFLLLGAANARFFNLRFQCAARGDYPNFVPPLRGSVINFALIGSDGGYLQRPVYLSSLLLAPGERYDILVDFAAAQQGGACRDVIVTNDAAAPYPGGEAVDGNTGVVMRFVILDRSPFKASSIPRRIVPVPSIDFSKIHRVRWKKLVETANPISGMPERVTIDGLRYMDTATEIPVQGTSEIWHIINLSADAHPIHLHLVQFRVVSRRAFDAQAYQANKCSFTSKNRPSCFVGPEMKAQKHEIGWKDTVPALPGQVLTFWVGWYGQDGKPFEFDPTTGPGYVWHCHILDHEDNDMMRPLKIRKQ
ncbi:unnamed protein product [Closterium sp. Yama58-4]|nr:unnamed protein product [Closterium sp. Yama58-4]